LQCGFVRSNFSFDIFLGLRFAPQYCVLSVPLAYQR